MLYSEMIAVCSVIHTKQVNTLCGQNVELVNAKLAVHLVTTVNISCGQFIKYKVQLMTYQFMYGIQHSALCHATIWPKVRTVPQVSANTHQSTPYALTVRPLRVHRTSKRRPLCSIKNANALTFGFCR
jgi:hypothetical protein